MTVIVSYRPVWGKGPETVFQKHQTVLGQADNDMDPRELILLELAAFISEQRNKGDFIVLCMDANKDTHLEKITQFARELSLKEAILH